MVKNEIIGKLPNHLKSFIVDQNYENYSAQDHAIWRFVMRQNVNYLPKVAHKSYLDGLRKTGIGIEKIPSINQMNLILKKIGWAAVTVDGFIPPSAFMEFQAYNVLVIAADIRQIGHIEYTPAPDIIHEAAGHAPIIADEEYAKYLKLFGEIGSKAFSSESDYKIYEAVRHLSIIKEDPKATRKQIKDATEVLEKLTIDNNSFSEMSQLRNLHWWTVEYGLIGTIDNPKIYGAGLLSSIGESYNCLKDHVKKIPYSIDAKNYSFDITTEQPQLFVTPDFNFLNKVLLEYKNDMAISTGGYKGLMKAINSKNLATFELNSGIEISGVISEVISDDTNTPVYIKTAGPTSLNYNGQELQGHSKKYHREGYGTVVGKLLNYEKPLEQFSEADFISVFGKNKTVKLSYFSGIIVQGMVKDALFKKGKLVLISFSKCLVKHNDVLLFDPEWGNYDLAVGSSVTSVFSGVADPDSYGYRIAPPIENTHKHYYSEREIKLHGFYAQINEMRNSGNIDHTKLDDLFNIIKSDFPEEWLLPLEILELQKNQGSKTYNATIDYLKKYAELNNHHKQSISSGLSLMIN